jgi:hypothetical protein
MDFTSMTFAGLATLGIVNVIGFFKPDLDSKVKFAISIGAALAFLFVPADVGNMLANKIKEAIEIAFAVSGTYKLATKVGGK